MTNSTKRSAGFLIITGLVLSLSITASGYGPGRRTASASTNQNNPDVAGTWSGTFQSKHANMSPFTVTMVIATNADGELLATASLSSNCVSDTVLHVTFEGSKVVLAGSDSDGNSITFRGALDSSTTLLQMGYILNGSASGRCELDEGDGSMGKR